MPGVLGMEFRGAAGVWGGGRPGLLGVSRSSLGSPPVRGRDTEAAGLDEVHVAAAGVAQDVHVALRVVELLAPRLAEPPARRSWEGVGGMGGAQSAVVGEGGGGGTIRQGSHSVKGSASTRSPISSPPAATRTGSVSLLWAWGGGKGDSSEMHTYPGDDATNRRGLAFRGEDTGCLQRDGQSGPDRTTARSGPFLTTPGGGGGSGEGGGW